MNTNTWDFCTLVETLICKVLRVSKEHPLFGLVMSDVRGQSFHDFTCCMGSKHDCQNVEMSGLVSALC